MHSEKSKKLTACTILLTLLAIFSGCVEREDPILLLSADEALSHGKTFLEQEKYFKARRHLVHAFEVEPNSRTGREALLLAADALYLQGGTDNYIKCEAKYRDFLNRFPTSDRADYAQFKVAACLAARSERPDRDQKMTHAAMNSLEELLRLYPTSEYVSEGKQQLRELSDQLAAHELIVGKFYNRYGGIGICPAAIARLEYLQENYPKYMGMDEVLVEIALAYQRCNQPDRAAESLQDLRRRFPESPFLEDAEKMEVDFIKLLLKRSKDAKTAKKTPVDEAPDDDTSEKTTDSESKDTETTH